MIPSLPPEERLAAHQGAVLEVTFAGLDFELEGSARLLEHARAVPLISIRQPLRQGLVRASNGVARVYVRLEEANDADLRGIGECMGARGIRWEWGEARGRALTQRAYVEWQVVRSRFHAEAKITSSARAAESLLTALAAAVLHRAGGAVLHAASIELPYGVVAFIGPSGAGKSTACAHVTGGRLFSVDRLAVVPAQPSNCGAHRWEAAALPGGTGTLPDVRLEGGSGKPLALVARVHHASTETSLAECSHAEAVAALRACAFHAGSGARSELELLGHLDRLAEQVPFANIHLRLGVALEPMLRDWLSRRPACSSAGADAPEMQSGPE
jgi:hypothetical protein